MENIATSNLWSVNLPTESLKMYNLHMQFTKLSVNDGETLWPFDKLLPDSLKQKVFEALYLNIPVLHASDNWVVVLLTESVHPYNPHQTRTSPHHAYLFCTAGWPSPKGWMACTGNRRKGAHETLYVSDCEAFRPEAVVSNDEKAALNWHTLVQVRSLS